GIDGSAKQGRKRVQVPCVRSPVWRSRQASGEEFAHYCCSGEKLVCTLGAPRDRWEHQTGEETGTGTVRPQPGLALATSKWRRVCSLRLLRREIGLHARSAAGSMGAPNWGRNGYRYRASAARFGARDKQVAKSLLTTVAQARNWSARSERRGIDGSTKLGKKRVQVPCVRSPVWRSRQASGEEFAHYGCS